MSKDAVATARTILELPKWWAGGRPEWVANAVKMPGYCFQAALAMQDGIQPAGLFVTGYFKHARVPGAADKLYLNLVYDNRRIHALHDNAPTRHRNEVGKGEAHYGGVIDHPHRHRICDDAVEGYAEPIDRISREAMWTMFMAECNIFGAPGLSAPPPSQTAFDL